MNDLDYQREISARDDEIAVLRADNAELRAQIGELMLALECERDRELADLCALRRPQ